jgi:hypothetical protein
VSLLDEPRAEPSAAETRASRDDDPHRKPPESDRIGPAGRIVKRMRAPRRIAWTLLGVLALLPATGRGADPAPPFDPELIARLVARNQRLLERRWSGATYDLVEVRTTYGKDGRPKEVQRRLYYVLAGEAGAEGSRDLILVDGRPATPEEVREAAEEDAKRRRRVEERAARKASTPPQVSGSEDDPIVDDRRLSELLSKFELRFVAEEVLDGRAVYVLDFAPRPGLPLGSVSDRALASMEGRTVIDAADLQIYSLTAHLTKNLKVGGGLLANVKDAGFTYRSVRLGPGFWFPCSVDLHVIGKKALFFRLDTGFRFEFANLKSFRVETESVIGEGPRGDGRPPGVR